MEQTVRNAVYQTRGPGTGDNDKQGRQTSGSGVISCPVSRRVCYCPAGLLTGISVLIPHSFEMTFLLLL